MNLAGNVWVAVRAHRGAMVLKNCVTTLWEYRVKIAFHCGPLPINNNNNNNNSPNKTPATSLNDIWAYTAGGSPLNLSQAAAQTAAVSAVAAMGLLNNESGTNTGIANEILKGLTTPTKQNT
jgi:hypothetical protein